MNDQRDESRDGIYGYAERSVNRHQTVGHMTAANRSTDSAVLGQPGYKELNRTKIARSKSLSSPFTNDYYNNNMKMEGVELPYSTLAEASDATKDSPTFASSGQTPSIFNETLLSTASPTQTSRHPTVIKHRKNPNSEPVYDLDNLLDSGTTGEMFDINANKPSLMKFEDLKINAVSPLTNEKSPLSCEDNAERSTVNSNCSDNNAGVVLQGGTRVTSGRNMSGPNKVTVGQQVSRDEEYKKPLSSSILNPIRNKISDPKVNSNSIFQEPSTCYAESLSKKQSESYSFGSVKSSDVESKKRTPIFTKRNLVYFCLILVIISLISGFTPAVVILANGTEKTVRNYFNSRSESDLKSLLTDLNLEYARKASPSEKKGLNKSRVAGNFGEGLNASSTIEGSNLRGFNTIHGIPAKYKNDEEVISAMSNPKFKSSVFYGLAYSPKDAMEPKCGITKRDVLLDVSFLSRTTTRLRNYGMQCNQSDFIISAFQDLNLNMSLAMGVWIGSDDQINRQQLDSMKYVLNKYPRKYFESIFIGNEVLFRQDKTSKELISYIKDTKAYLKKLGYGDIPVGTSEIGSLIDTDILKGCDIIGANVHPFFGGEKVEKGSDWTFDFLKYQIEPLKKDIPTKIVITEVGWPSGGGSYQNSVSSLPNQQKFMDKYICDAYKNDYAWYYFEAFDEPWKKVFYEDGNTWETRWGVFTSDRKFKDGIKLTDC